MQVTATLTKTRKTRGGTGWRWGLGGADSVTGGLEKQNWEAHPFNHQYQKSTSAENTKVWGREERCLILNTWKRK